MVSRESRFARPPYQTAALASGSRTGMDVPRSSTTSMGHSDRNPVNPRVSDGFPREPIRATAVPNGRAGVWFAHWNGRATQLDDEHGPLILVQSAEPRDVIVREMTGRKGVASDGSSGEREGLPGVPHVV